MRDMRVQYIAVSRVSEAEQIMFLSCRDISGRARLFYINKGEVRTKVRSGWREADPLTVGMLLQIAGSSIYKRPTYRVENLSQELCG